MKRTFVILAIAMMVISTVTSCASSKGMSGRGCNANKGFIGYGSR